VSYEVDFWGKNKASAASAEASLDANRFDRQTVALTVTSSIVSTYLQVLSLHDRIAVAREHVANAEHVLTLVEVQQNAGAASRLDLARQRSVVAQQKAEHAGPDAAGARSAVGAGDPARQNAADLLRSAGRGWTRSPCPKCRRDCRPSSCRAGPISAAPRPAWPPPMPTSPSARANLFPSISLTGEMGAQSSALLSLLNAPNLLANVSTSLLAPIFDGGRLKRERDYAIARKQELVQVYRATVITALSEVDTALGQIRSLDEQRGLKTAELEQARQAYDLSEIRYKSGAEDLMTVLDTQRALTDVQNDMGLLKLRRLQATVSLYKALGGGWDGGSKRG
jgi:multidrug efflux system outer membrane protein